MKDRQNQIRAIDGIDRKNNIGTRDQIDKTETMHEVNWMDKEDTMHKDGQGRYHQKTNQKQQIRQET